jgi:hypothetical protein
MSELTQAEINEYLDKYHAMDGDQRDYVAWRVTGYVLGRCSEQRDQVSLDIMHYFAKEVDSQSKT